MSKIIITIKDGEIKSKVEGILGMTCKDTDKFLKQLGNVIRDDKTKEYYQYAEVKENVNIQR